MILYSSVESIISQENKKKSLKTISSIQYSANVLSQLSFLYDFPGKLEMGVVIF